MSEDDKVFKDVCKLLNKHNVNYWVCHGTLLGIIREDRLLPWDHDIDFAVWDSETTKKELVDIFVNNGYKQELVFGDMDCLHFYGVNKKIDISFYKVKKGVASIKWAAPPSSLLLKVYLYCVQIIWSEFSGDVKLSKNIVKKAMQIILIKILLIFKYFFNKKPKEILYKKAIRRMSYTGYSYPCELMNFKKIKYKDTLIQIPRDPEECLKMTYGDNWRVPKKNYIWYEEATNLSG